MILKTFENEWILNGHKQLLVEILSRRGLRTRLKRTCSLADILDIARVNMLLLHNVFVVSCSNNNIILIDLLNRISVKYKKIPVDIMVLDYRTHMSLRLLIFQCFILKIHTMLVANLSLS